MGGGVVIGDLSDIPVRRPAQRRERPGRRRAGPGLNSATGGRLAVHPRDVAAGLRAFDPGAHRIAHVATVDGVAYVDDSKATNPHAAAASLQSFPTWSGSPAGSPRAPASTTSSRRRRTGSAARS